MREAAKWLQAAVDGGRPFAKLHLAHLTLMRAKRTRRWHISKSPFQRVCNGDAHRCAGPLTACAVLPASVLSAY